MKAQVYRNSTPEYQRKTNRVQSKTETTPGTPGNKNNEISKKKSKSCEISDDESDTDDTLNNNMLRLDHENETSGHSDYYQIEQPYSNPPKRDTNQTKDKN